MSVMNIELSRTQYPAVLGSTWRAETVGDRLGFDVSMFRTPSEQDGRFAQPIPCPKTKGADRRIDWDENFSDAVAPLLVRLHRLARRILHSVDLAEDAVQEAILSLWKEGRLPPNPSAWLNRAVVNRSLHLNRSRHRRRRHELLACLHRPESDPTGDAARALEAEEISARIGQALSMLSDRLRMVFILREIEQMDYESIADRLRIPLGTVRSRLARSREALQRALGDNDCAST
ncbi:MAG: RNA polymerase sigma factor [Isosphaeraceae bacterium]